MELKIHVGYLDYYEDGTAGIDKQWAIDQVGDGQFEDFIPIEEGDHLVIFGSRLPVIFNRIIVPVYPRVGGCWFPKDFSADVWNMLFDQATKLTGVLMKKG